MKILVTGSAGFIGFHLTKYLLERGDIVVGLDNINDYYDVNLKYGRLSEAGITRESVSLKKYSISSKYPNYSFVQADLSDLQYLKEICEIEKFDVICNLAAQAGVRYSLINPQAYIDSNIQGFLNILECCRDNQIKHLVYASSSSVYGLNDEMPFSESHKTDRPISLYAATKKSNELMAHTYSHLFNFQTTGLRFFTVYGPWGRPDMALFSFTDRILKGLPISIYNNGEMRRDFTYIDDIVDGIVKVIDGPISLGTFDKTPSSESLSSVYNIGRGMPVNLMDFISELESCLGINCIKELMPMQDGDVAQTWADIENMRSRFNYNPKYSLQIGVKAFIDWYKNYYNIQSIAQ
ncbi:NAD-dependent epimerase/dehydratase family protein [Daejeonella oryzae]|uniref:NAD-dependent epimerase/dehydratase family protein n=1 Tax=Daejeonella oryzae TaxID=1122943 RepID=UPI0004274D1D|nr:NAD-dependent epimerase/dehydratase family protein [Daejeonella oryzae]